MVHYVTFDSVCLHYMITRAIIFVTWIYRMQAVTVSDVYSPNFVLSSQQMHDHRTTTILDWLALLIHQRVRGRRFTAS